MPPLIPLLVFAAVFLVVLSLAGSRRELAYARLQGVIAETLPRAVQLQQPFSRRVLFPALQRLAAALARFTPAQAIERTARQLLMAGLWRIDPLIFIAIRFLAAAGLAAAVILSGLALRARPVPTLVLMALCGLVGHLAPTVWLRGRIHRRQYDIIKRFPDMLDLLTVCVEAGLGLDQALERVSERSRGPLRDEIRRYLDEVRLGKDRLEALRDIGTRTGVPDVHSFVTTLLQATHLGVSIADVLRTQAEYARTMRRQRIEERAMKAPLKVLLPIIVFIFPAIFVAIAGPAAIHLLGIFRTFGRAGP